MSDELCAVEKLIIEIQKHPWLFDLSRLDYRNLQKKKHSWNAISRVIGLSVDDCMQKWRNLRDRYARELRAIRRKGELTGKKIESPWPLMNRMEFLMNHVKHRSLNSWYWNSDVSNHVQNEDSELGAEPEISVSEGFDNDSKEITASHNTMHEDCMQLPKSEVPGGNSSECNWKNPPMFLNEQNIDFPSPCSSTAGCSGVSGPVTKKRSLEPPDDESVASAVYYQRSPKERSVAQDEEHHFGMIVASKLRKLPERIKDEAEIEILQLLLKVAK